MTTKTIEKAKILTPQELENYRYPIPESWLKVIGILKGKKKVNALAYQRKIRKEWSRRLAKLERLANNASR